MDQAKAKRGFEIHAAMLVDDAALGDGDLASVGSHLIVGRATHPPDKRRGFQLDIHALRAVLKKPLTLRIAGVVPGNEVNQFVVP